MTRRILVPLFLLAVIFSATALPLRPSTHPKGQTAPSFGFERPPAPGPRSAAAIRISEQLP